MKDNKFYCLFSAVFLSLVLFSNSTAIYAKETTGVSIDERRASYYIAAYSAGLFQSGSRIDVDFVVAAYCEDIKVVVDLQENNGGSWKSVKTWTQTGAGPSYGGTVAYIGSSNKEYRAEISFNAIVSGIVVETRA